MNENSEFPVVLYTTPEGRVTVKAIVRDETLWMTQMAMSELFGVNKPAISKHLKNIFESGELQELSVVSKMETTAADGKRYLTGFYNLDAIIAKAGEEYDQFNRTQIIVSDFDREVRRLLDGENGDRGEGHGKEG